MITDVGKLSISGKLIGYILSLFGLLILGEPHLGTGILTDTFVGDTWQINAVGMLLMTVGAVLVTGLPTANGIWEKIEYGVPFIIFIVGFSLLYINTYGGDFFVQNVMTYTLFGFVTATLIVAIQSIYGSE